MLCILLKLIVKTMKMVKLVKYASKWHIEKLHLLFFVSGRAVYQYTVGEAVFLWSF